MSSKQVFNVKDKVFAKIRGYPAWPAIISSVKGDIPSRQRYSVYFYGTGERGQCKPEELFPYEENKSTLGKPNKRKYFAEALLQIEEDEDNQILPGDDSQIFDTPSNTIPVDQGSSEDEIEKSNETNLESDGKSTINESTLSKGKKIVASRMSLDPSTSKGTKRKRSDVQSEVSSKKSQSNKPNILESLNLKERFKSITLEEHLDHGVSEGVISEQQKLKQTADKNISAGGKVSETTNKQSETHNTTESVLETSDVLLDSSKAVKSLSKEKNSPSSSTSEISSTNSANVGRVSRSGRKIKPKIYSDDINESEVSKRSGSIKRNSEKHNTSSNNETDSSEQNYKTKGTKSETRKTSKSRASTSVPQLAVAVDLVKKEINGDGKLPLTLRDLMVSTLSSIETELGKACQKKNNKIDILNTEIDLLGSIYKLRLSLRTDHADYKKALELFEHIMELKMNDLMLMKHREIVNTVKQLTMYTGNPKEWNLNEEETLFHNEKSTLIRHKADVLYNKLTSLFTVPNGQSFEDSFNQEAGDFLKCTENLASHQMYGITSKNDFQ